MYKGQFLQDKYVNNKFFNNKENGVFLDIGANDGITFSNTYFFEKELNWKGMCIEPIESVYEQLVLNRSSINIKGCAWNCDTTMKFRQVNGGGEMLSGIVDAYNMQHQQRIELESKETGYVDIDVQCYDINSLLEKYKLFEIDFLSIDTEGSEYNILQCIDFTRFKIKVIIAENNYNDYEVRKLLASNGYVFDSRLDIDDIFVLSI
jgi:FkbM family methyltransferase